MISLTEASHNGDQEHNSSVRYDIETLSQKLWDLLEKDERSPRCSLQHKPILLHNYLSIGSLIHNRNSLGFFKVRGRFSFWFLFSQSVWTSSTKLIIFQDFWNYESVLANTLTLILDFWISILLIHFVWLVFCA